MATNIKLKKSAVAGKVPLTSDLEYGEIAINYTDGLLFFKNSSNTVQSIGASPVGVDSNAVFAIIDSNYIQNRVPESYISTIVDSAYVSLRTPAGTNNFGTVSVVGDSSFSATTEGDTITFAGGTGVSIVTDVAQKRVTISSTPSTVYDFGTIASPVQFTLDMGAI
jgi:hypothetical protein